MSAPEHLVFVTGRMAKARLEKVAATLPPERYAWSIADAGVKVAALMTEEIIRRRVTVPVPTFTATSPAYHRPACPPEPRPARP